MGSYKQLHVTYSVDSCRVMERVEYQIGIIERIHETIHLSLGQNPHETLYQTRF
jgi:hypothetical protein